MMTKDTGIFKLKYARNPGSVKLCFTARELGQKPIRYWANVGRVNKKGAFYNAIRSFKKLSGDLTANGICSLYYYMGAIVSCPFHVQWMGDSFELSLYDPFGLKTRLSISRKVKSNQERLTKEEIRKIEKFLVFQEHAMSRGYDYIMEISGNRHSCSSLMDSTKEIREALSSVKVEGDSMR